MNSGRLPVGDRPTTGLPLHAHPAQESRKPALPEIRLLEHERAAAFEIDEEHRTDDGNGAAELLYGFDAADVQRLSLGQATQCDWPPALIGADGGPLGHEGCWDGQA